MKRIIRAALVIAVILIVSITTFRIRPALTTNSASIPDGRTLNERLLDATRNGELDNVEQLIRRGANVDARTDSYATPLILAASTGNVAIAQVLLKAGADVNAQEGSPGPTALMEAAYLGNIPLVQILLAAKANVNLKNSVGSTALHLAARGGKVEVMQLLLAAGANPASQDHHFLGTPLHHAAIGGHADAVRCLLKHGCPVGLRDESGESPLHDAAIGGNVDVVKALLDGGADIDVVSTEEGETPLMWAARESKQTSVLEFLIQSRADVNKTNNQGGTALMLARQTGRNEAVRILENAGGKEWDNLCYAIAKGDVSAARVFLDEKGLNHPRQNELDDALCLAARRGRTDIVEELLTHGANPNTRLNGDQTPLLLACRNGSLEIGRQLLAAGADVNVSRGLTEDTPLMMAAAYIPAEFVGELIAKGADVNAITADGNTAVGWAAFGGKLETMKVLVDHGAKVDIRIGRADAYVGWPLIKAIRQGNIALVDFLLAHGVDVNAVDGHGKTPLMYAVEYGQLDVAELLLAQGAGISAQAGYDSNNTATKLAENTGRTEFSALFHILEFEKHIPGKVEHWDDGAWLASVKKMIASPETPSPLKADARYLVAVADLQSLKTQGSVSNGITRATVEADILELRKDQPNDPRAAMVQQQLEATLVSHSKTPFDLKFHAVNGVDCDLMKLRGKVVLVDFWATWCGPCRAGIPLIVSAYNQLHKDGFEIVGISFDQSKDQLTNFLREAGISWPQYFDGKGWENDIGQRYGIQSIPTAWLVDKKGFIRSVEGPGSNLVTEVRKLLAESGNNN